MKLEEINKQNLEEFSKLNDAYVALHQYLTRHKKIEPELLKVVKDFEKVTVEYSLFTNKIINELNRR